MGVDFLSIDGFECAGHVGEHDIPNFVLLNRAREQLVDPKTGKQVPYIASGGMANGASLAAALSLGACGINMGTRFMCTIEAPIHNNIKQAIVDSSEDDTELLMRRWKNTSRLFKNKVTAAAGKIERESTTGKFEEIAEYVSGKRGRQVFLNGDKDFGVSVPSYCSDPCLRRKFDSRIARVLMRQTGMDCGHLHWTDTRYSDVRRSVKTNRIRGWSDCEAAGQFIQGR